jgi:hypothetical protein
MSGYSEDEYQRRVYERQKRVDDYEASKRNFRKYWKGYEDENALREDNFNRYRRDELSPSVKNELMEFAYQEAKASGHDQLAKKINRDGALKYEALTLPRDRRVDDNLYRHQPIKKVLFLTDLDEQYGSGQEEARRIADELKRKGEKSAGFGAAFDMLKEMSEDPLGAAAKYAVKGDK